MRQKESEKVRLRYCSTPTHSHRNSPDRNRIFKATGASRTLAARPLTAEAESRRSSRSAARKNGLDADTRISDLRDGQDGRAIQPRATLELVACDSPGWGRLSRSNLPALETKHLTDSNAQQIRSLGLMAPFDLELHCDHAATTESLPSLVS